METAERLAPPMVKNRMEQPSESYLRIENPSQCQDLLEKLCELGGVQLLGLSPDGQSQPVLLMDVHAGEQLVLDLTSSPELAPQLAKDGDGCQLTGWVDRGLLRTAPLHEWLPLDVPGRTQMACAWPEWVEILQRRGSFRAELTSRMTVPVELQMTADAKPLGGRLLNLSQGGCQVELPATQAAELQIGQSIERITLCFPSGQKIDLQAQIRQRQVSRDWLAVRFGCAFGAVRADQERRLWFYVREIEREAARSALDGDNRAPSALFQPPRAAPPGQRQHGLDYVTPMARRLARVALYLNSQLLHLQHGQNIDPAQLSRFTESLLALLEDDREELLFAVHCLTDDQPLIQHCIAVAVRLSDLARSQGLPNDLIKAICACALIHDLGKGLLPPELLRSESFDPTQREAFARHVELLRERMVGCKWLPEAVVKGVIGNINERLDGSGYPQGLKDEQLGELARVAAVVDVIDAMGRPRPDRPQQTISGIYRDLLNRDNQLDRRWCQNYVRHFGLIPIGTLVRFASGALGWVERLDRDRRIAQVRLTDQPGLRGAALSEPVSGNELIALGQVEGLVAPTANGA